MDLADAAPTAGIVACLALLLSLAAPLLLIADAGTGLSVYYASGTLGAAGVGFLAALLVIVFLSGRQERRPADTVAGIAVVAGLALFALAAAWALAVDVQNLYSFPASAKLDPVAPLARARRGRAGARQRRRLRPGGAVTRADGDRRRAAVGRVRGGEAARSHGFRRRSVVPYRKALKSNRTTLWWTRSGS